MPHDLDECNITSRGDHYRLVSRASVSASLDDVFAFFADARNLDLLTPPFLRFRILTPLPVVMGVGTLIEYRLVLRGIPIRWQSEITTWEPPYRFIDEQRRGPYRRWIHEHRFEEHGGETDIVDEVEYAVPGGRFIHDLFVRHDLEKVFRFRTQTMTSDLPKIIRATYRAEST